MLRSSQPLRNDARRKQRPLQLIGWAVIRPVGALQPSAFLPAAAAHSRCKFGLLAASLGGALRRGCILSLTLGGGWLGYAPARPCAKCLGSCAPADAACQRVRMASVHGRSLLGSFQACLPRRQAKRHGQGERTYQPVQVAEVPSANRTSWRETNKYEAVGPCSDRLLVGRPLPTTVIWRP